MSEPTDNIDPLGVTLAGYAALRGKHRDVLRLDRTPLGRNESDPAVVFKRHDEYDG